MADAVELAVAYIQIVPSMDGSRTAIEKAIIPGAGEAGDKAAGKFSSTWSSGLARLGKLAAPAVVGGAVIAAGKSLYDLGAVFDKVTDTIRVGTGASGEALDGLVSVAKNVGKTVPAEFETIGTTVADVNTRLGLSGPVLEKVASQYLEASRILGTDVDVTKTSAAFNAFSIEGENVSAALDTLFQVSQATGAGMNELASIAAQNAPTAKMLGLSFEDTTAMIGAFDKAGLNSSRMMAGMGRGLVQLAKDGEEPKAAFGRVTEEIGNLLAQGDKAGALDLASKLFGTRNATQFIGALEQGTIGVGDMMTAIGATSDTILGVSGETASFAEKWQLVKNNAMLALEPLATTVFEALGSAINGVLPHMTAFGEWLGENQWVIAGFAAVVGGILVASFIAWTASIWAANAALLANPITWIVLAIAGLIAALVALVMNWDSVVAWLQGVWAATVEWLSSTWDSIVQAVTGACTAIGDAVSNAWQWMVDTVTGLGQQIWSAVSGAWESVKTTTSNAINAVVGFVQTLPGRALAAISSLVQNLVGVATRTWTGVKQAFTSGISAAVGFVRGLPGKAASALSGLASALRGKATQAWNGFKQAVQTGITASVNLVRQLPGKIVAALSGLGSRLVGSGKAMLDGFTRGIRNGFTNAVDAVKNGIGKIRNFFPFSPAKEGPLSGRGYVTYSGDALTEDFAKHIEQGTAKIRAAASGASEAATLTGRFSPQAVELPATNSQVVQHNTVHLPEWVRSFDDIVRVLSSPGLAAHAI